MEALVVSGHPPEALESALDGAPVFDPGSNGTPDVEGATRVILGVTDDMVLTGWLASPGFQQLALRHENGEIRLLAVQVGSTPCALVPPGVPLVTESDLPKALRSLREGADLSLPRPVAATYSSEEHALSWERVAVRASAGEDWQTVASELGLPTHEPTPGALLEQRFRLLAPRATTALFAQWAAEDRLDGQPATIYVLHPHESAGGPALATAAETWSTLDHPAITPLLGSGVLPDGRTWIARAGEDSSTLATRMLAGDLSTDDRLLILLDAIDGLEAAHDQGVVHGGLDANRVLVHADGSASITDIGIVVLGQHAAADGPYTAPERLDPTEPLAVANDLYGLAALAMLVVHGEPLPFWVARDPARMIASLDLSPALGAALQDALSWDPERRPTSVATIRDAVLANAADAERLTRHALSQGREDTAEALLERLFSDGSEGHELDQLRLELARKRASRGDPATAIAALSELAQSTGSPAALWLEIARLQDEHGLDGAVDSWEAAFEAHQTRTEAVEALRGLTTHDSTRFLRWGRALALYAEETEHAELAHRLGTAFHAAGDEPAALLWLDRAAAGGLADPELLALREQIRSARGEWTDVVRSMARQAEQGLGDPVALLAKAARLARRATPDPEPVADLYRKLLAIAPEHPEAHRHLARHTSRSGDAEGALEHYDALCSGAHATAADHCGHARQLLSGGQREAARVAAQSALELEPAHEVALRVARRAATECGAFAEAAAHQDRLVELNASTDGGGHAGRLVRAGDLHRFDGQMDAATERYDEAIAFTPNHLGAWWGVYAVERARITEGPAAPLCFGPEEALARLFAEMLDANHVLTALTKNSLGAALAERCDPDAMWTVCVAAVDTLGYHEAIGPDLFDRMLDAFPERSERIVAVRNLWSGGAKHTASFPVAECMSWVDDGLDFEPELHRELVYRAGWPRESGGIEPLLEQLMIRDTPLSVLPLHSDPGDDEDLLLEAPEIPMLVIGEGAAATEHEVESTAVLGPDEAPALPGELALHWHGDRLYLSVSDGLIEREGDRSTEVRLRGGDLLTWQGVRIRFYRVSDREALGTVEHTESGSTAEAENLIEPVPAPDIGDTPALLFGEAGHRMAVPLDQPETAVIERYDGSLVFSHTVPEHYIAVVLYRHGHHYIEQELTNATGFGGRLAARSMEHDEVVTIGSVEFQYRKVSSNGPTLAIPEPSLAPRPMLILRDGSLLGQPVPLTEGLFRVGRGRNCELQIRTDALLSRVHCRIHGEEGGWFVEDAGSSNGTRVNGLAVRGRHALEDGDIIEIGHTEIDFTHGRVRSSDVDVDVDVEVDALFDDDSEYDVVVDEASSPDEPIALGPDNDPIEVDTVLASAVDLEEAFAMAANLGSWTREQAQEKIRVANRAFRVLFSALDEADGEGMGHAELQLLVASGATVYRGLLDGLELEAAVLPVEPILMALEDRPESERRRLLSTTLLDLIDRATDVVCGHLSDADEEVVLSRMAHLGHRRSLQVS